ncbi:unnamed protein product [Orchesella dallaii]|uniref:Mitochondrial nucleoid factor 1 n=1 Tax=Orchesella dallaii TaxID=48710 RepID=A0ABP1QYE7_9HEXA
MSSVVYRNFLRLLEKWPADPTKKGRDLGEYIRNGIAVAFRGGSDEPRNAAKCQDICNRLNNIAGNRYKDAFYVSETSSASGLSQFDCHCIISNESLKLLEDESKKGITSRVKQLISSEKK